MATKKQIAALKYLIFIANNGNDLSKKILIFLIDQSERFKKEVCITLVENREGYTADEIRKVECEGNYFNSLLTLIGCNFYFSNHYGDFDSTRVGNPFNNDGQFVGADISQVSSPGLILEGMPLRYTFWLSKDYYSKKALYVVATREILEKVNIEE